MSSARAFLFVHSDNIEIWEYSFRVMFSFFSLRSRTIDHEHFLLFYEENYELTVYDCKLSFELSSILTIYK